jgi:hypothetical protein
MKRMALILLLVATVVSIGFSQSDTGMGTLAGTVLDSRGKAVAGASVTMQSATGGDPHATKSNAQGRFFFPELVHGYYDVRASSGGMTSEWKHNLEVNTGKQTEVTLRLRAK